MLHLCRIHMSSARSCVGQPLAGVVACWEQMAIRVHSHHDRGMPEPYLYHFRRQALAAAVNWVDAPRRIEMAQCVKTGVFRLAVGVGQASGPHRRLQRAQDVVVATDPAAGGRKHESELAARAPQFPFAERVEHRGPKRHGALASFGFRRAHLTVAVGALAHVQFAVLEIDINAIASRAVPTIASR
jgi:hypothetical protein